MKKLLQSAIIIYFSLFILSCEQVALEVVTESQAREVLHEHLENRYSEPFAIGRMRRRATDSTMWYEAEIIPVRYMDTSKESDKYYQAVGTVRINHDKKGNESLSTGGDVYMTVRLNEEANSFFLPKLQELFGEQVLPIIQIRTREIINNGNNFRKIFEYNNSIGADFYIEGGIYIFGRIDNLDEKDVYREKIFEFIQHMKSEKMFGHVNLAFYILDERCLTERFDKEIGDNLLNARNEFKTADEFLTYRRTQMDLPTEEFSEMDKVSINTRMNNFNKGNLIEMLELRYNRFSTIYHTAIYSREFLEFESRLSDYKKLDYNLLEELMSVNTMKVNYREFDPEKLRNYEWDGE